MRAWLRNPTVDLWLPVAVLPPVLLADGLLSSKGAPVDLLSVVLTYAAVLPLLLRKRLGFFGLVGPLVLGVIVLLADYEPYTTVVALPAWALFELARNCGRRETLQAALLVPPAVAISVYPFANDGGEFASIAITNVLTCELALAVGYALWHSGETVAREKLAAEADASRRLDEERLRIAREVHDVVAHSMVAINVQAGVAAHLLDADTSQAREALKQIKRTSGEALTDLRATLGILRDPAREAPTAPAAGLGDLDTVAGRLRAAGVAVHVDVDGVDGVPTPVHAASYRIVQEALTNVLRHAGANAASVVVRTRSDALTIAVTDDGDGGHGSGGAGAGLRGMRERAAALGGTLDSGPCPEGGWRVEAVLPLPGAAA